MARAKSAPNIIESSSLRLEFDTKDREWTLHRKLAGEWSPTFCSGFIQLTLQDGRTLRTDQQHFTQKFTKKKSVDFIGKGTSLVVRNFHNGVELDVRFTLYNSIKAASIELHVGNKTREALECKELNLLTSSAAASMLFNDGPVFVQINGSPLQSESDVVEADTDALTNFWHTLLYSPSSRESLLLGFLTNKFAVNSFEVRRLSASGREFGMKSISSLNTLVIGRGKSITSDRLMIQFSESPLESLERYSGLCYKFSTGKKQPFLTGHSPRDHVPTGWSSGNLPRADVTESDVIENLEAAGTHFKAAGLRYLNVGDGYQRAAGDWETNERFPHGHRWLTHQIHRCGFLAGLWLAPFAVTEKSEVYRHHQDWLLKSSDGTLKKVSTNRAWGGDIYVLDPTVTEVQRWLRKLFQKVTHTWRYDCVEIDFLSYAALGPPYQKAATTAQAYRIGLQAIRDAVGSKKLLLGCRALLGSSVGLVDGLRIGQDGEASWSGLQTVAGATSHHYSSHSNVCFNYPDWLVVGKPLTLDQARTRAALRALSGQVNLMGDNLSELTTERIELLLKTLPVHEGKGVPVDLFDLANEIGMCIRSGGGAEYRLARLAQFRTGDDLNWKEPKFDDSDWNLVSIPQSWENYEGLENYDGFGWYRLKFYLPTDWNQADLTIALGRIDDCDETFLNGTKIGSCGAMPPQYQTAWNLFRVYHIPKEAVNWKGENVLAIRVYDGGGQGGIHSLKKLHLPRIWNLPVKKKSKQWNVVGAFNWEDSPQTIRMAFDRLGLSPSEKYLVYESWASEFLGEIQEGADLELQPTSSKILAIHESRGRPEVLSTSRHITQGAVDLKEVKWNEKKLTIEGQSVNLIRGDYDLIVWIPAGYKFVKAITAVKYETSEISPSLLKITLKLGKDKPLAWKLQFQRQSQ